jgi:type II secretory pathway pseudopilin PulG
VNFRASCATRQKVVIRPAHAGWQAFTLIEVLLALGLLTFALGAVYASWTGVIKASKVGLDAAAAAQRQRMAIRVVEEALGEAQLFVANNRYYGFTNESVMSGAGSLSFVARLPESFPRSGKFGDFTVRRVTFSVEAGPDRRKELVMRQNPILMEMDQDEQAHPVLLARDVEKFQTEFWDTNKNDWVDEWLPTNQLPKLVRVSLQVKYTGVQATRTADLVTRVVSLPTMGVQPMWQVPAVGRGGNPAPKPGVNPIPPK